MDNNAKNMGHISFIFNRDKRLPFISKYDFEIHDRG